MRDSREVEGGGATLREREKESEIIKGNHMIGARRIKNRERVTVLGRERNEKKIIEPLNGRSLKAEIR